VTRRIMSMTDESEQPAQESPTPQAPPPPAPAPPAPTSENAEQHLSWVGKGADTSKTEER
jgi:hypothetical protein